MCRKLDGVMVCWKRNCFKTELFYNLSFQLFHLYFTLYFNLYFNLFFNLFYALIRPFLKSTQPIVFFTNLIIFACFFLELCLFVYTAGKYSCYEQVLRVSVGSDSHTLVWQEKRKESVTSALMIDFLVLAFQACLLFSACFLFRNIAWDFIVSFRRARRTSKTELCDKKSFNKIFFFQLDTGNSEIPCFLFYWE